MKRMPLLLLPTILFAIFFSSAAIAQSSLGKESLRGLKGVYVLIENFEPDLEKAGLWKSQIQTDAELKLRKAGIRVATVAEGLSNNEIGQLYINLSSKSSNESLVAFDISIEMDQEVRLARQGAAGPTMLASTYHVAGTVGTVGINHVRDDLRAAINDQIDIFLNDYLAMNPKP